jgi:hypothetical protein
MNQIPVVPIETELATKDWRGQIYQRHSSFQWVLTTENEPDSCSADRDGACNQRLEGQGRGVATRVRVSIGGQRHGDGGGGTELAGLV